MKKLFFSLSIFLFSAAVFAQNAGEIVIKGTVVTKDDKPAPSVTVQVKGTKRATVTNEKGEFTFKELKPGNYEIEVSSVGYNKISEGVKVETGIIATVSFKLAESASQLTEVLVSTNKKSYIAAKSSTSLRLNAELIEVPQNITVATRQTLTDMGLLTKSEIFRISSAITKSYGSELDLTFQIRGMDATYGTYRNGVGGPIWWNAQEDAAMIERMEFVKGPAGFMLSNAEPGGLVNVVTRQPTHQHIREVGVGVGSWNMMRTYLDLGGDFKKDGKLTYRFNVGVEKKNEYFQFSDFYRYWVCPVLKYDFSDKTSVTVEHNYVKAATMANSQYSFSINGDIKALPVDLAIVDPNLGKFWGRDIYNRMHIKHKLNNDWTINAQGAYMTTDWDGTTMYPESINVAKDTIFRYLSYSDWTGRLTNVQLFADGKFNTGKNAEHKVLIGMDYGNSYDGSSYEDDYLINRYPLAIKNPVYHLPKESMQLSGENMTSSFATNEWASLYVQDHIKLYEKLIVTLAGRFTHLITDQVVDGTRNPDDKTNDNKFTPRTGLTYLFSKNISAYIMHDESFLAQRGKTVDGNRLPPLTGSNNEFGIKALLFNKQLSITASVYDMRKNDVGTSDFANPGFFLKTGQIRSTGLDLDIAGRINANWYININYAYVNPRITKDAEPTYIGLQNAGTCKNLSNVWVKYQFNEGILKGFGIGTGFQYTDKRSAVSPGWNSENGNLYLPAYTLFDAALSYASGRFNVNFNAYNLANTRYGTGGWYYPDFQEYMFYQGTPRNFRLQTTFRL